MPTPRWLSKISPVSLRAMWARTSGDLLVGAGINPSETPAIWWMGSDGGGNWNGQAIGPNGPFAYGSNLSVVVRATSLITGPLTSAPYRVLDQGQPVARPRWLTDPMLLRPDQRFVPDVYPDVVQLPRGLFWSSWIACAIHWGIGAFITQLDEQGQPLAGTLRNIDGRLLATERDDNGALHWVLGANGTDDKAVFDRGGELTLGPVTYKIVVLRNPHSPVDAEGMSLGTFALSPSTFQLAQQIETYSSGTYRSGIPAGYLKVDQSMNSMTQTQADELKAKWMNSHGGDRRSIAVLNAFTSFVPLNLSPVDAALGESIRLNIAAVAFAFGLDPDVLGAGLSNSGTYKNATEFWQRHRDFGLALWISAVQDTLTALLPGNQTVMINLDGFANPPVKERFDAYSTALAAGFLDIDEVRRLEGLPPRPPGDESVADQERALSQQEAVQKVYLGVTNGIITVAEARQMINDAGGNLDVNALDEPEREPPPAPTPIDSRAKRPAALTR